MRRAPGQVASLVANAHRACVLAHAAETLFVGLFGLLLALTAIAWQGSTLASLSAWSAAALAGIAAGAAWWLEVRPARTTVARRIDLELGLDGALFTAYEQVDASTSPPLAQLLARSVQERVSRRRALRCALPNSMPFLALPFLGATLLALVQAVEPEPPASRAWAPSVAAFAGSMEGVESAAHESLGLGEIDAQTLRDLVALNADARELLRETRNGGAGPEGARAALEELREELERHASRHSPLSELTEALERAGARADSALIQGEPLAGRGEGSEGPLGPAGAPRGTDPGLRGETGAESGAAGDPKLANGVGDGRMKDRSPPDDGASDAAAGAERSPEAAENRPVEQGSAGIASGRWWSERDAAVVERWVRWRRESDPQPETRDEDD